ncbi:MAG: MiaB/RimO family radical SAM methylthiotransferase [Candidatus Shapirobacteria bacterium]
MANKIRTYYLKTFGCAMNEADSERIKSIFNSRGHRETKNIAKAKVIIINSCIVRKSAENRAYGLINNLKKKNYQGQIILTGCLAGWALLDKTHKNLKVLQKRIGLKIKMVLIEDLAGFLVKPKRAKNNLALIPISNGCNHFCSYCIVPFGRGKEISRPEKVIFAEVKKALKDGFSEILLLGQNINSYGKDLKNTSFPELLEKIAKIKNVKKISFLSANPWDFSDELIKVIAENKNISREIHLPLQSGDDAILKKMNRPYMAKEYLNLVNKIKRAIPEVLFTTDVIVGFPTETKKQFQNTVKLAKKIGFQKAYLAKYSPRPGTIATKLKDDVSPPEKKRRWRILEELINK